MELNFLVSNADTTPGVNGGRLTGEGFGGAIVAFTERDASESAGLKFSQHMSAGAGIISLFSQVT